MTRAEMIAQCVPRESNFISEAILVLAVMCAILYLLLRFGVRLEDKHLLKRVRREAVK